MSRTLPCVTLADPWASLVVNGDKTLETRKGALLSGFTGPLVIHRSLAPCDPYDLSRWGLRVPARPKGWPDDDRGAALGVVYVTRTRKHMAMYPIEEWQRRAACYHDIEGRYLSELGRAAWFPFPIGATGKQGRWTIEVPDGALPDWVTTFERATS